MCIMSCSKYGMWRVAYSCESQALGAKVDQGQRWSASNIQYMHVT